MQSKDRSIEVHYTNVQRQSGISDCDIFAIAFATSVCLGEDPANQTFKQGEMRQHPISCIEEGKMASFPKFYKHRRPKPVKKETLAIYCSCI